MNFVLISAIFILEIITIYVRIFFFQSLEQIFQPNILKFDFEKLLR